MLMVIQRECLSSATVRTLAREARTQQYRTLAGRHKPGYFVELSYLEGLPNLSPDFFRREARGDRTTGKDARCLPCICRVSAF
jgi:hypothetical protein